MVLYLPLGEWCAALGYILRAPTACCSIGFRFNFPAPLYWRRAATYRAGDIIDMSRDRDRLPLDSRTQAVIDGLPPDEREHLQILMKQTAASQRSMLETALDEAISMVPAPLRKRVQKLFLGSD